MYGVINHVLLHVQDVLKLFISAGVLSTIYIVGLSNDEFDALLAWLNGTALAIV